MLPAPLLVPPALSVQPPPPPPHPLQDDVLSGFSWVSSSLEAHVGVSAE